MLAGLVASGSEARDMLSGVHVVGGVELREAAVEESSVGVAEKLDSDMITHPSPAAIEDVATSVAMGAAMSVAIGGGVLLARERDKMLARRQLQRC